MRRSVYIICGILLAAAIVVVPALSARTEKVIYDDGKGNALIAHGGTKEVGGGGPTRASSHRQAHDLSSAGQVSLAVTPEEHLIPFHKWKETPYGDSAVTAEFWTDVWAGGTLELWAYAEGNTYTGWWGTVPQYYCDKIELGESWKFSGLSVTVSVPAAVGFSASGSTARWSGGYDGNDAYDLWHIYSGVEAQSWIWISSMRQSSSGSHFFSHGVSGGPTWVTATATQGKDLLL
jgi:hypothetical protein